MNFDKGDTIVIALTPKDGDIIVDVGYKPAKTPESAPESPDASEKPTEPKKMTYKEEIEALRRMFARIPAKKTDDAPVKKELKAPEGMDDNYFLPIPSPDAIGCIKGRIVRAFAELYGMRLHEVESLFDFEEMDEVIEENADVFWALEPSQVAVAIHRRIVGACNAE